MRFFFPQREYSQAGAFGGGSIPPGTYVETLTANTGGAVGPDGSGNINVVGDGSTITIAGNPGTNTLTASVISGSSEITITGDTGGGLTSNTFTFTGGSTGITFNGSGTTETLEGTLVVANGGTGATTLTGVLIGNGTSAVTGNAITQYDVLVGGASNAISSVAPSATSGIPLVSQGSATNPHFGTAVVAGGGTGEVSFTAYAPVVGGTTATGALQSAGAGISNSGYVLTSNGSSALPSWQSVSGAGAITTIDGDSGSMTPTAGVVTISGGTTGLTTSASSSTMDLTGTLKLANGGTNASLTASNGGIFYSTASAGAILSGTATANQMLQSGSSTAPAWSTATWPATTTINQLLYSSSNNVVGGVTAGDYGVLISSSSGVPSWLANGTTGQVLTATTSGTPSWENAAASSISITGNSGGAQTGNAFTFTGGTTGLTFAGAADTLTVGGTLVVANGGTDASSFNTNGVVISGTSSTAALSALSLTSGQVVIGGTSTPAAATLTAGTGITIANGNNTITISAGGAGFTWHDVTGGSATLAAENGYIADSGSLTTFTMPTNNSIGDTIKIVGKGSGGWTIVYGLLQNIIFGAATTTTTSGSLSSTNAADCVELVCTTASITAPIFTVTSVIGNLTVA